VSPTCRYRSAMAEPKRRWPLPHVLYSDEEDDICFGHTSDPSFDIGPLGPSEDACQDCWTSDRLSRQSVPCWIDGADHRSQQSTSTNVNESFWIPENNQSFPTFEGSQPDFGVSENTRHDDWSCEGSTQQLGLTRQESGSSLTRPKKACKGQRDRYRKLVMRLTDQVRENPRAIDIDKMLATVPPSVASNGWLKNKLATRLVREKYLAMQLPSDTQHH